MPAIDTVAAAIAKGKSMDLKLTGKLAFISGSTAGIGHAIATALAHEGARVIVNGREPASVEDAVARISAGPGGEVIGFAGDMSTAAAASALVARFPDIQILVNNLVLPAMKRADWGRIIFISSESAVQIPAEMIHYGMTKTAQLAIARGLAESLAGTGITVNSVLPGPTRSRGVADFVDALAKAGGSTAETVEKEFFATARPTSLIKRFESPEEIAAMVAYVASPLSSGTTGTALRVDGGVTKSVF
jgi:NAD(P)-dependent dehydrogenase (short-subunit alcohol dehydrogenase family)